MLSVEKRVEAHYSQGDIFSTIISALEKNGINTDKLTRKDISGVDELHIRGHEVTRELAQQADLQPGMRVLDVGCGLGGPCRFLADEFGCHATGIDITAEYIYTAKRLAELTGLQQGTHFVQGSATDLPFPDNSFDMVWTQHVQMNIGDKKQFYAEIARVLNPGGQFIYYDIFSVGEEPVYYPVPWAEDASMSHLVTTGRLHEILQETGLLLLNATDQTEKSVTAFEKMLAQVNKAGFPVLGPHLVNGANALQRMQNVYRNLSEKKIVVESGIAKKKLYNDKN